MTVVKSPKTSKNGNRLEKPAEEKPTLKKKTKRVDTIQALKIAEMSVPIQGLSPIIQHRFSEKARKAIEDKQQKRAQGPREAREPETEYRAAMYHMPGSKKDSTYPDLGIPAAAFRKAIKSAASRYVNPKYGAVVLGSVFVLDDGGGLVRISYKKQVMREDPVRIPSGFDMRYRPELHEWEAVLRIQFNEAVISSEQILNLVQQAGFSVGVGDWRPEKSGQSGRFNVKTQK